MRREKGYCLRLALVCIAAACSGSDESHDRDLPSERADAKFGPAGGSLGNDFGVTLQIPQGALRDETTIVLGVAALSEAELVARFAAAGVNGTLVSQIWQFSPAGTTFAKPVSITLPSPVATGAEVAVVWLQGEGKEPAPKPGAKADHAATHRALQLLTSSTHSVLVQPHGVTFQVSGLGLGAVVQLAPSPSCKSFDGACNAGCAYATDKDCCSPVIVAGKHLGASRVIDGAADGVQGLALGDVTGDGLADVVAALENERRLVLYPSKAPDGFSAQVILDAGVGARDAALADLDGDGHLDLGAALGDDGAAVYFGVGGGNTPMKKVVIYEHGRERVQRLWFADLDADGRLDALLATGTGLVALAGDGTGAFGAARDVWGPVSKRQISVVLADLDGDSVVDLGVTWFDVDSGDAQLNWHKGGGDGTFSAPTRLDDTLAEPFAVAAADLDADGILDLLVADSDRDQVLAYPGGGAGVFTAPDVVADGLDGPRDLLVTDLDGDKVPDILVAASNDDEIGWYGRTGPGKFVLKGRIDNQSNGATEVVAGDIDGDGDVDLAYGATTNDRVSWFVNGGICQCTTDADCADKSVCTVETCDTAADKCVVKVTPGCCNDDSECDDREVCTADKCNQQNRCSNAPIAGCCHAVSECTGDLCNPPHCTNNRCGTTPVPGCCTSAAACGDLNVCTTDACTLNQCVNTAITGCCQTNAECSDGVTCTADSCASNACVSVFDAAGCPAGDVCDLLIASTICDQQSLTTPYCHAAKAAGASAPAAKVASARVSSSACLSGALLAAGSPLDAACRADPLCVVNASKTLCPGGAGPLCETALTGCSNGTTGGAVDWARPLESSVSGDPTALGAAELDGDAAEELIVATAAAVWRTDLVSLASTLVDDAVGAQAVRIGDLDAKQGPDVVTLAGQSATGVAVPGQVVAYLHQSNGVYSRSVLSPGLVGKDLALADMDGDKDLDVVVTGESTAWLTNPGAAGGAWTLETLGGAPSGSNVGAGDIDGDGDADVVVRATTGVFLMERTAAGWSPPQSLAAAAEAIAVADANGDGADEVYIVAAGPGGKSTLTAYAPKGGAAPLPADASQPSPADAIVVRDLDGDGDVDTAVWSASASGLTAVWNESHGSQTVTTHPLLTPAPFSAIVTTRQPTFADVDGDGKVDLVVGYAGGKVRAFRQTPMCCANAAACDDANPCTQDTCVASGCGHARVAGCCAVAADCNDGNECTEDSCLAGQCQNAAKAVGTACSKGVCLAGPPPTCGGCTTDAQCDDGDGCTANSCNAATYVCETKKCEGGEVVWSDFSTVPSPATQASPFTFPLGAGTLGDVVFYRSNDWPIGTYTPPGAANGSFVSTLLAGYPFSWKGAFTYLNINVPPGQAANDGSVTFDFGTAATNHGADWRYVVGFAALGFGNTGPVVLTSSVRLEALGSFAAFKSGAYATFDGDKTITGPTGGPNTEMQFFLVPANTTAVSFDIDDRSVTGPDTFGFWVGAVDLNIGLCQGSGLAAQCLTNACGDAVRRGGEECDDGNTAAGDGCSPSCAIEAKATCTGDIKSVCAVAGCATGADCDDGNDCTVDACVAKACHNAAQPVGTSCNGGVCDGAAAPACVQCTANTQCDDANGCSTDVCDLSTNTCRITQCDGAKVLWSQFSNVPATATAGSPYTFQIGSLQTAKFYRSNAWPISLFTPPAANGNFVSTLLGGYPFAWQGDFPYLNINTPAGITKNSGSITFDFGDAATAHGADWRFVVGFAALAFSSTGPTVLTSSEPLEELGRYDAFNTGIYASFDGDKTIIGPTGGPNTGMQFFVLPSGATSVTFAIDDQSIFGPDTFGFWVGAVDLAVGLCNGSGATAQCVYNTCGDGVRRSGEACDDGGKAGGDGCSATCTIEPGATCKGDVKTLCSVNTCAVGNGGCDPNALCTHGSPSPTCTCKPGFAGTGTTCHPDADGDGIADSGFGVLCTAAATTACNDNCPTTFNPDQADTDLDGRGDACELALIKVVPDDPAANMRLGWAMAISGNTMAITSYVNDGEKGVVYVFVWNGGTWTQQAKLLGAGGQFGYSVALDGDTLVACAAFQESCHVYFRTGTVWAEQVASLKGADSHYDDTFGASAALHGDRMIIGAPGHTTGGTKSGAAYVFKRSAGLWTQEAKLMPSDPVAGGRFGFSVDLSDDTAIVGADGVGSGAGAAYVFVGAPWTQQARLTPATPVTGGRFGAGVAVEGDAAIVGASVARAAWAFDRAGTSWTEKQKLVGSAVGSDTYGRKVAIAGDHALISADGDGKKGTLAGRAYLYQRKPLTGWTLREDITAPGAAPHDHFSEGMALGACWGGASALIDSPHSDMGAGFMFNVCN